MMKLVIAVIQGSDAESIVDELARAGHKATQITSAGGYLRESNVTLLVGTAKEHVLAVIKIIDQFSNARRRFVNPLMPFAAVSDADDASSIRVGASVFVVNVSRFERLTG